MDKDEESNYRKNGKNEMLFCGTLNYKPNEEALSFFCRQIFPFIRRKIPDATLTIIGRGITDEVEKLKLLSGINVIGYVDDTKPFYDHAKLSVVPLLNGGGTRVKILESMIYKTSVVSTAIGAEGLDVIDGVHIAIADKPEEFANRCVELLLDSEKCMRIAMNGHALIKEKYGIDKFVASMDKFFDAYQKEYASARS
ncbi:MAG: glycosyltransferase family 4 protein [Candidatus Omnitrophica bacterium]|nr:glycosyltransferase family 4 protein [Candidatus Omnitrophota bacterium]